MENRAFEVDPLDEEGCPPTCSMSSSFPPRTKAFGCAMTSGESLEHLPINVRRPVFYSSNFYPALQANSYQGRDSSSVCINNDSSGSSTPDSMYKQTSTLFRKLPGIVSRFARSHDDTASSNCSILPILTTLFPILSWLPTYKVRSDLLSDIITGVTILALHIPQGLAYGRLAGVESINGLYVSLFPVVLYAIFGGSRQISVGTFAVVCIACKDVLDTLDAQGLVIDGQHFNASTKSIGDLSATRIEILTSLCLLVGLIQFLLGLFRLGILATLLSDPIISAFVVACSIYVFTSQVFALFGVSSAAVPANEPEIPFELIKDWLRLFRRLPKSNIITVIISTVTIFSLLLCKIVFEPFLIKKFNLKNITIPIDILAIATLTTLSYVFDFNGRYKVAIIPKLSTGFEGMPLVPRVDLWSKLFTSAILIAFIAYTATYTLSKIFARKHQYEIYPNQELIALGIANVFSSFLLCFPSSGSLARSAVQDKVGGRTQLASIISSGLIIIFLLFLSHLLDSLPNCVLSCIIVVALRSTLSQFTEVFYFWKISKLDGIVWIGTFLFVILFGVANGLLYGLIIGLAFLVLRLAVPQINLKYHVPGSECYLPSSLATAANPSNGLSNCAGVVVFDFHGPFIFLNAERFKKCFEENILRTIKTEQSNLICHFDCNDVREKMVTNASTIPITQTVVFDMSRVPYVDYKAAECLLELDAELAELNVTLLLAQPNEQILDCFLRCDMFDKFDPKRCFLTVHDAVCFVNEFH